VQRYSEDEEMLCVTSERGWQHSIPFRASHFAYPRPKKL
jgi:hypothetical protein